MGTISLLGLGTLAGSHGALYGATRTRLTSRSCSDDSSGAGSSFFTSSRAAHALQRCRVGSVVISRGVSLTTACLSRSHEGHEGHEEER
jgi:hypothetical protein